MQGTLSSVSLCCTAALLAGAASAQDLTISIYGGGYAEDIRREIIAPFEALHGVTVAMEAGASGDRMARMIATGGRGTDLMYIVDYQMADLLARGILQPVTPGSITNMDALLPFAQDPLGDGMCPAFTVNAVGLSYSTALETPPTSWADLFAEDVAGTVGLPDLSITYGPFVLAQAAELAGGGLEDIDPGFDTVLGMRDRAQIFTRGGQALEAIHQGEMAMAPNLNIFVARDESAPSAFAYPEEGAIGLLNLVCVVNGTQNAELAEKLIDFHLSYEVQQAMLNNHGEATVRADVPPPADPNPTIIPEAEYARLRFYDPNVIHASRPAWFERWQEEVIAE